MLPDTNSIGGAESVLESARSQLTERLRAGEPCRAEELFRQYPILFDNPALALQLICAEFAVRRELGRQAPLDEWYERFPQWREELRDRFEVYAQPRSKDPPHADSSPTVPYGPAGVARSSTPAPLPRLGRYELLEPIGGGGMGVVHKARGPAPLERIVALKQLRGGRLALPEEVQRFALEAKVAGGLRHPNILPIYDQGEHDGQLYFTMPYIEGGCLATHLPRFRDDPRAAVALVEKIARAVQFLHDNGILHRDLKPSNILLDEHDEPLVTDFGLAKLLEDDVRLTETGRVMGTPAYLSPEQAAGRNKQVAETSDVWALGVILYELLTGQRPFWSEDRDELYYLVQTADPVPPSKLTRSVDAGLENIVLKCLAKDPAERYATAATLAGDLRRWLDGQKPLARKPSWLARAGKSVRRHPWLSAAAAALVFLAVGLGAGYAWMRAQDPAIKALNELKDGHAVTWIPKEGPPLAYTPSFGAEEATFSANRAAPFTISTGNAAQVDLLTDPQSDHFVLHVQVAQVDNPDGDGEVGITLAHRTLHTGNDLHHLLLVLYLEQDSLEGPDPTVSVRLLHFKDDRHSLHPDRGATGKGLSLPVIPRDAPERWRQFDIAITPEGIQFECDSKRVSNLTWKQVAEQTRILTQVVLKKENLAGIDQPALGPHEALGLYVRSGKGAFRSFVIDPRPDGN